MYMAGAPVGAVGGLEQRRSGHMGCVVAAEAELVDRRAAGTLQNYNTGREGILAAWREARTEWQLILQLAFPFVALS